MAYEMLNGARKGSSRNLMIGPGVMTRNFNPATFDPKDRNTWGELIGATKGGHNISVNTEWHATEVDGALGTVDGYEWLVGADASLKVTFLEMTRENLLMKLPAYVIKEHNENYDIIEHDGSIAPTGTGTIALFTTLIGSTVPIVFILDNARCTNPFEIATGTGKDDITCEAEFQARYAEDEFTKIPFRVLYPKGGSAVIAPTFNPTSGTYADEQTVTLTTVEPGAEIYYTTDGSYPTNASTKYTAPITVSVTTTIKAVAIKGLDTSAPVTASYTITP